MRFDQSVIVNSVILQVEGEYYPYIPATNTEPAEHPCVELESVVIQNQNIIDILREDYIVDIENEVLRIMQEQ